MQKYLVLMATEAKDENGNDKTVYEEKVFFAETQKEIKALTGFRAVVTSEYVNHPSPEVMQRTLIAMGVDLVKFYSECEKTATELDKAEAELCAAGDEAALKRKARREAQLAESEKRKAEREAKKAKEAKKNAAKK